MMIKGLIADIILVVYLMGTLYVRFVVEDTLVGHPFISMGVGVVMLLFIWALIKVKVLKPNYFGLMKK